MNLTKYQSRKVMRELLKDFTPLQVAKRMAYMREAGIVNEYINLPTAEESLKCIISHLHDLRECENEDCDNIDEHENMTDTELSIGIGIICEDCMRSAW